MTLRHQTLPTLDELIVSEREITTTTTVMETLSRRFGNGEWEARAGNQKIVGTSPLSALLTATVIEFGFRDLDATSFPSEGNVFIGTQLTVRPTEILGTLADGRTFTLMVSDPETYVTSPEWNIDSASTVVTGDQTAAIGTDPVAFDYQQLGYEQTTTETVNVKLWAKRRDFTASDQFASPSSVVSYVTDTRFIVRDTPGITWAAGDTFTNSDGDFYTVIGTGRLGTRGSYHELLVRTSSA